MVSGRKPGQSVGPWSRPRRTACRATLSRIIPVSRGGCALAEPPRAHRVTTTIVVGARMRGLRVERLECSAGQGRVTAGPGLPGDPAPGSEAQRERRSILAEELEPGAALPEPARGHRAAVEGRTDYPAPLDSQRENAGRISAPDDIGAGGSFGMLEPRGEGRHGAKQQHDRGAAGNGPDSGTIGSQIGRAHV